MAREIRFDLVIDGVGESIKDFDKLNSEIEQTKQNVEGVSNVNLDKLNNSFEKAAKGFATAAKGISGAVNLAAGSLGVFGVENEKVAQTLLKVQSALALTTGLKDFSEFLLESSAATKLATVAQAAYAAVVGTTTGALKLFRLALVATGIGAFVVAIGTLVANWDKVVSAVSSAIDAFDSLGTGVKVVVSILFPMIGVIKGIQFALEELGIIESKQEEERKQQSENQLERIRKEKEAYDKANEKRLSDIDKEIALNRSLGKAVDELLIKRKKEEIAIQEIERKNAERYLFFLERAGVARQADRDYVDAAKAESDKLYFELTLLQNEFSQVIQANLKKEAELQEKNANDAKERRRVENEEENKQQQEYFRRINKQFEYEINAKKKAAEDLKKLRDDELKKQNRDDLAAIEIELLNVEKGSLAELDILQRKLLLQSDIELQNEELTKNEKELINEQYFADLAALDESYRKKENDNFKVSVEERREIISSNLIRLGNSIGAIRGPLESIGAIFNTATNNASLFTDSITSAITTFNDEGADLGDKVLAVGAAITAGLEIFGAALDQIAASSEEKSAQRISRIENETAIQQANLEQQFNNETITSVELTKAKQKLELETFKKVEKERKKEFERQKKLRIASATIDMIQGAVTAFATAFQLGPIAGPIVGGILSAAVLAFGAVNIANIAKQQYVAGTPPSISAPTIPSLNLGSAGGSDAGKNENRTADLFPVNSGAVGGSGNIEGLGQPSGSGKTDNSDRRVFVVEADITKVQNRVTAIDDRSTIV